MRTSSADATALTFNRTSMELKHGSQDGILNTRAPFNRTSMELKRACVGADRKEVRLLIEPVWN